MKNSPAFAVLDVETTGLSPLTGDRVCEIAVIRAQEGREPVEWSTLVNPGRPIGMAESVHGISDEMVADAPPFHRVTDHLLDLLENTVLVAHNARFDVGFLKYEFFASGMSFINIPVIDTLLLARRHFRFPSNSLGRVALALSIDAAGAHRALADVRMTLRILEHFRKDLAARGMKSLDDLICGSTSRL